MYTQAELCEIVSISKASFYRLRDNEPDFKRLIQRESVRQGKQLVYSSLVLDWLEKHQQPQQNPARLAEAQETAGEAVESPVTAPDRESVEIAAQQISALQGELEAIQAQLVAAQHENELLTVKLEAAERERERLNAQNVELLNSQGHLLLLLSQEKAEKERLLPAASDRAGADQSQTVPEITQPRRGWWGRLFGK